MIILDCYTGLGDCIYIRPFARALAEQSDETVVVMTPWVELFQDIPNLKIAKPAYTLRTQGKNMQRIEKGNPDFKWFEPSDAEKASATKIKMSYDQADLKTGGIIKTFEKKCGTDFNPAYFDIPDFSDKINIAALNGKIGADIERDKIAFLRPVTVRKEWTNTARPPDPRYVADAARILMESGYHVVSVADLAENEEWMLAPHPDAHVKLYKGELTMVELLYFIQKSAIAVGGVGFIVPAALAARTPQFIIFGGLGAYNAIHKITDYRMEDVNRLVGYALPVQFCRCTDSRHGCSKFINDLPEQLYRYLSIIQKD